jgi:hypothetical protein
MIIKLVDQVSGERSLKQLSAQAQEFQVLYRFLQKRKLLQFCVLFISTRTAVSSLNSSTHKRLIDIIRPSNKTVEALDEV